MDYGATDAVTRRDSWEAFRDSARSEARRVILFTTGGETSLGEFSFQASDILLFGRESAGVPENVRSAVDARVTIPMANGQRSLNVVTSAAIALWEACRQTGAGPSGETNA